MKNTTKGFTLIELLVVIAIIGLLSSVVLASLSTARAKSKAARVAADVHSMELALQMMYDDTGCWPLEGGLYANECVGTTTQNPLFKSLVSTKTWGMDKYLPNASAYPFDSGAEWAYDHDNDNWAGDCSAIYSGGVNLTLMKAGAIYDVTPDEYKYIEKAIDNTSDANLMTGQAKWCGKLQWNEAGGSNRGFVIHIAKP